MRFGRKAKAAILSALALFGVGTAAVATAAWFEIKSQSPDVEMHTADPNLQIDNENVTGYKINPSLGMDGFPDYESNTVAHKKGSSTSGSYETENNNQDNADLNFDVPASGIGYYLIKKNPGDTYKYRYSGEVYSWKFADFENRGINYVRLDSKEISLADSFIVRNYSYDVANYKTINTKVAVSKDHNDGNFTIDDKTYEIKVTLAGTYTIWLNTATSKLTFELIQAAPTEPSPLAAPKYLRNADTHTITVYYAIETTYTVKANPNTGAGWQGAVTMTKQNYKYYDKNVYKAQITSTSDDFYEIQFQLYNGDTWASQQLALDNTKTSYSDLDNKIWWEGSGTTRDDFVDAEFGLLYDGWILIGKSGQGSTTFGDPSTDDFTVSKAKRFSSDADNLGKITVELNPGDQFKVHYLKKGNTSTSGEWFGANNLELYYNGGSTTDFSIVGLYFANMNADANCEVKSTIDSFTCTIYFTNEKKINVNPVSSVIVKASKFNFEGEFEEVSATNAAVDDVTFGSSISVSTINSLSLTIPTNYSRVDTAVYSDERCTASIDSSFIANENPKTVYIKVKENPITIYLVAYFSDTATGADGVADSTLKVTLSTQFGANSSVSGSELHTLWNATYQDAIQHNNRNYDYGRIETSAHTSAFPTGTVANETTLYVRYVRRSHTITLTPSYFAADGSTRLDFTIQGSQTEQLLDYDDFTTSKTFGNCEYKDDVNGIWYVFARADDVWYSDQNCTTPFSNKLRGNTTLFAKMVAKPLTSFYVDADYPGWNNCYLYMWGGLDGVTSDMEHSLTAKVVATDSGNRLFKVSIPTESITGFLLHPGHTTNMQTEDILISELAGSTSKYCFIENNDGNVKNASFVEHRSTTTTGVWVQKYSSGAWNNIEGVTGTDGQLLYGDGVGNDFILETGLQLTNGDIIRVYDSKADVSYGYAQYVEGNKTKHTYVTSNGISSDSLTITRLGTATATARFNFYVTHEDKLSIAMVPDYGNGFYIMKYNPTDKTENYIGAIKMDSADYVASYNGWYCGNKNEKIFIRSYLDAVDSICTSLVTETPGMATMNTTEGDPDRYCITFENTGHYNIRVTGRIVEISTYQVDDFFSLNRLDSSLLVGNNSQKQQEIWRQKTAVVMEIPFQANNTFPASVALDVECSASWVGVRFAVYAEKQEHPYETMHGDSASTYTSTYLTDASTDSLIADTRNLTINPAQSNKFYAYVLIDYRYNVTSDNLAGATSPEITLYLQLTQR